MKHLKTYESIDLDRLASFYEGDKYEIKIINSNENFWYKDLINSVLIAIKSDGKFKVVPPKLLTLYNISAKNYSAYNNKEFLYQDSVKYVNINDCEILKKL